MYGHIFMNLKKRRKEFKFHVEPWNRFRFSREINKKVVDSSPFQAYNFAKYLERTDDWNGFLLFGTVSYL